MKFLNIYLCDFINNLDVLNKFLNLIIKIYYLQLSISIEQDCLSILIYFKKKKGKGN